MLSVLLLISRPATVGFWEKCLDLWLFQRVYIFDATWLERPNTNSKQQWYLYEIFISYKTQAIVLLYPPLNPGTHLHVTPWGANLLTSHLHYNSYNVLFLPTVYKKELHGDRSFLMSSPYYDLAKCFVSMILFKWHKVTIILNLILCGEETNVDGS